MKAHDDMSTNNVLKNNNLIVFIVFLIFNIKHIINTIGHNVNDFVSNIK